MFLQRLKVIICSGLVMAFISSIESRESASGIMIAIYTLAYSIAFTIGALPLQIVLQKQKFYKSFSLLILVCYIIGAFLIFALIGVSDFNFESSLYLESYLYLYIVSAGAIFWFFDSIFSSKK